MTATDGAPKLPHKTSNSRLVTASTGDDGSRTREHTLGAGAHQLSHVIDVQDPSRVLECVRIERQLRFQRIVRHYLSQILHGCTNTDCDTRTCLSSISRNATRPVRPPTQLTARALAHHLASEEDPAISLCPNKLKVVPSSFEISGTIDANTWGGNGGHETSQSLMGRINMQKQAKKDTKSLSQNLFDSTVIICSFSEPLASPAAVFDALRNSRNASQQHVSDRGNEARAISTPSRGGQEVNLSIASSARLLEDPGITGSNEVEPKREHSNPSRLLRQTSEISGQHQIHRIPFDPGTSTTSSRSAGPGCVRHDAATESPKMLISKTGRKNFTLGGSTTSREPPNPVSPASLSKVNPEETTPTFARIAALSFLTSKDLIVLKEQVRRRRRARRTHQYDYDVDYDSSRPPRPAKSFVNRSLYYTLSDSETLLKSFRENNTAFAESPLPHLDSEQLTPAFRDWQQRNGALTFDSLSLALDSLFVPPSCLSTNNTSATSHQLSTKFDGSHDIHKKSRYLDSLEAAHIVIICVHALTSCVEVGWPHTWAQVRQLRSWGVMLPDAQPKIDGYSDPYVKIFDAFDYEPALRLAEKLMRGIGARCGFEMIEKAMKASNKDIDANPCGSEEMLHILLRHLHVTEINARQGKQKLAPPSSSKEDPGWTVTATLVEWLKTIIMKRWDGKGTIHKWSSVGSSFMFLKAIYNYSTIHGSMNLTRQMFDFPFLNLRLDGVDECLTFSDWKDQPNHFHVLEHPHLFQQTDLVSFFRTINFNSMLLQYNQTSRTQQLQGSLDMFLRDPHRWLLRNQMKVTLSEYFILDVTREDPLKDTLDQLWGAEKRMLLKPLKVKMGKGEGEVGLDHGGVTYEFFREVLREAFDSRYGMFNVDPKTRMTWFQPDSLEPGWKFEMIGIMFSLAVYNGVTLPVTFPVAFYRSLLPEDAPLRDADCGTGTSYIKDGWPELARSLEQLLKWTDGDVGDVIMREYSFSYDAFGQRIDHNMEQPYTHTLKPSPTHDPTTPNSSDPELVTNANREQFVTDYINHLTHLSITPQLAAFKKGFNTCLSPRSLHFFSPTSLRALVEGTTTISIPSLRAITHYENGYHATHPTILHFWTYAESLSQDDAARLLEFVTASDRVPVTGYEGITFYIVRTGGIAKEDRDMLPTSSTCFGKLYLPEYEGLERVREKVGVAIRNSRGFGVV